VCVCVCVCVCVFKNEIGLPREGVCFGHFLFAYLVRERRVSAVSLYNMSRSFS
jgi:hypothetical protein